jgi:phosphoenolpyruvate carboxykinase (ATP)
MSLLERPTAPIAELDLSGASRVWWNLHPPTLYEHAIRRDEGHIAEGGALVVDTGRHTGRSPNDKFIVREPDSAGEVWWGAVNKPFDAARFARLLARMQGFLAGRELWVQDCVAGADTAYSMPIRVVTTSAWQSLFARTMFIPQTSANDPEGQPEFTILSAPEFRADPARDGTRSDVFVIISFAQRLVLIGGTHYAGEIKKAVFTLLNYLLPQRGVLSMHASVNVGAGGDAAVFFGLSGTGKTTLSADPERRLIGDDEHGWSARGVFNVEGGCYAKVIRLSAAAEPEIFATTRRFGTLLENVALDPNTRELDLDDDGRTENTRAVYPLSYIANADLSGTCGHPRTIVMLTADAFGVLPPISRLSPEQAIYHFLSGYTAKVAGTERGVTEPEATFSTCFAAPFLVLPPATYAGMLGDLIRAHDVRVWLVNTGWSGGPPGVGARMPIAHTRAMVRAALAGALDDAPLARDPIFGLQVPQRCPGVPGELLNPRSTWPDAAAYDRQALALAARFRENFAQFADAVPAAVREAGPNTIRE